MRNSERHDQSERYKQGLKLVFRTVYSQAILISSIPAIFPWQTSFSVIWRHVTDWALLT